MGATVKEVVEAHSEPVKAEVPVETLPFMKMRLGLLQPNRGDVVAIKRASDRTVEPVRRWVVLNDSLPQIRAQTMSCLEATEGKGGAVVLRVADRPKFDNLQATIRQHREGIAALEQVMRQLNAFAATDFLQELYDRRKALRGVEPQAKGTLANEATAAIARGRGRMQSVEESLSKDEIYLAHRKRTEQQAETANKSLAMVDEKIAKIEGILARVAASL